MTHDEFNVVLNETIRKCKATLATKKDLYASDQDRLDNFKQAARLQKCTQAKALWGMVSKHIIALSSYINLLEDGYAVNAEELEEKIGDIINYHILLRGIFKEGGLI
jgi:hypothetical protein